MHKFDLLIRCGFLIDPANDRIGRFDIGLAGEHIVAVESELCPDIACEVYDASNKYVFPGLVDTHVHLTPGIWSSGFQMIAKAGVTCVLECSGWVEDVIDGMVQHGSGISVAALNRLDPKVTISSLDASKIELSKYLDHSLKAGAIGFKILGGHLPLSPQTIASAIEVANEAQAYIACHCGSTENGSNLLGMLETLELTGDYRLHICHTNAYCRGLTHGSPVIESMLALKALATHKNMISDSNMAPFNYCETRFEGETIRDRVTQTWLRAGGFEPNREGLLAAAMRGYMRVVKSVDKVAVYLEPEEGACYLEDSNFDAWASFPVNHRSSAFLMATEKDEIGHFIVTALATDGGGIPRNVLLSHGLSLVRFDALTFSEFVMKSARMPALMLSLSSKGHLGQGADGDLIVVDPDTHQVLLTVAMGKIIMRQGSVIGTGGRMITTQRGITSLEDRKIPYKTVDLSSSLLFTKLTHDA